MAINRKLWGRTPDGKPIYKYTLTNASGASVVLGSVGAAIVSVNVPDKDGKLGDVALGYGKAESYFGDGPYLGKVPGRFANRIAKGKFTLDGKTYSVPVNCGPNHLHGGPDGFSRQVWSPASARAAWSSNMCPPTAKWASPARSWSWRAMSGARRTSSASPSAPSPTAAR